MKQLDVVRKLDEVFSHRKLRNHAAKRSVIKYGASETTTAIVLDLSVSKQILLSRSFASKNYFDDGYRRLSDAESSVGIVRRFFSHGPLFLEGEEHRASKQLFNDLLKDQADKLEIIAPRIRSIMLNRKRRFNSALDFARLFVEICLASIMKNLSSIPLKMGLNALRNRENVFYFYFRPRRHRIANDALAYLERKATPTDAFAKLVCHSLIVMAYDPLVATICANQGEGRTHDFEASADRYCPVSFVSRECIESVAIGETSFAKGDICYVSLVPAIDEASADGLSFGTGVHACIGKQISLKILQLAEQIIVTDFKEGFDKKPVVSPDGVFLSFRN
ncbi:MAG: hypothetical protein E2O36_04370 [Proteobacteria bacterium]|nr:MAG: hypothetical protein E2O36_04370 [Pseudomonadota bacterium]